MLWMPPPSWFVAMILAFPAHLVVTGAIFYLHGWKPGLITFPIAIVVYAISVVGGTLVAASSGPLALLTLVISLVAGVWITFLSGRAIGQHTAD